MKYYVNWNDAAFPEIREYTRGCSYEPITLAEAKAAIIEHAKHIIEHWKEIIKATKATTRKDVIEETRGNA